MNTISHLKCWDIERYSEPFKRRDNSTTETSVGKSMQYAEHMACHPWKNTHLCNCNCNWNWWKYLELELVYFSKKELELIFVQLKELELFFKLLMELEVELYLVKLIEPNPALCYYNHIVLLWLH